MKTVTDLFEPYIGVKEYNGIVAEIQTWFYGYVYKASWCATSMSYFLNKLDLLNKIGKKQENVYEMMEMCRKSGVGTFYYKNDIPSNYTVKRGTILFLLNSGTVMNSTSSKHVTSTYEDFLWKSSGNIKCLGGNQSDMIRVSQYTQSKVYAIYVPPYADENKKESHTTLRRGSKGNEVKELQNILNELGYKDNSGEKLAVDGSFGRRTEEAVKRFQSANNLEVDGICGQKTWAKLDERPKMKCTNVSVKTSLNCRKCPSTKCDIIKVLKTGYKDKYIEESNGWVHLENAGGWVNKKYLDVI